MAQTIGIVSTKGGVGKTSLTASIGGILADMGQKVLLIDGDFQQSLSNYYKLVDTAPKGILELITTLDAEDCISVTSIDRLHVIRSDDPTAKLLYWLKESTNNIYHLKAALQRLQDSYDFILIDSQGARSIMQEAIILASDLLISPIVPEVLDSQEFLRGTINMLVSLEPLPGLGIPALPVPPLHGLIYKQNRTADTLLVANLIRKEFFKLSKGKASILDTFVPSLATYRKAAARNQPVHRIETTRRGPTPSALSVYTKLVHELFPHLSDITPMPLTDLMVDG